MTPTVQRDQTQQEENMSCVCFDVWASGLFLITEVSLSLHHQVNRPDLTVWPYYPYKSWYYYYLHHHQIPTLSWELHPVTSIQLIICYWHRERIHLCNDKYLYFRQIFNVITAVYFPVVSLSVCHRTLPSHRGGWRSDCEEWDTPGAKKPSGSYLAFQQILTSLSQFVIQSPACWERRDGNYHWA